MPIRASNGVLWETSNTVEAFWAYIRKGDYKMWYFRFYTKWTFNFLRMLAVYVIWALAPIFQGLGGAAVFVPLCQVIGSVGSSLQEVAESVLTVFISTSQIAEVAELLNLETTEQACRDPRPQTSPGRGVSRWSGCTAAPGLCALAAPTPAAPAPGRCRRSHRARATSATDRTSCS